MSTTTNPTSKKGIRYTDEQKKEIIDFVADYNAANNRGGQAKASEKYGVSQLTISNWIKGSGVSSKKSAKPSKAAKAPKVAKTKKAKSGRGGSRYTDEQKQEVVDFVTEYNADNGRGGQSKAAAKFGVSPLTVMAWLKAAGVKKGGRKKVSTLTKAEKAPKAAKAASKSSAPSGDFDAQLTNLLALSKEVNKAQAELDKAVAKFESAKAKL